jgi:serine/threonine protein kinase
MSLRPDWPPETAVHLVSEPTPRPGLPQSLLGCFPGDPEPASGNVGGDEFGPLDLHLPADAFATVMPRPGEAAPARAADPPATAGVPARPADVRVEAALPAIGSVIEKYRIEQLLGTGGFAAVYRATHLLLRIPVALKLLKPKVLSHSPQLADLLCEEARFAAQLNHPNVVRVFDVTHNPKITYIVMEYIEGESLHHVIQTKGRLRPLQALRYGIHVTQGLKAALDQGLIHRDIKPANILVARGGMAKIVDLGLAQHSADIGRRDPEAAKMIVGTPLYMAPEQASKPEDVDFRADVYSLGATLYHAVTGRPPFQDPDPVRVLALHQKEAVKPPESVVPGLPFDLSRVLMWMLQKDRAARPDYDQLLACLEEAHKAVSIDVDIEGLVD